MSLLRTKHKTRTIKLSIIRLVQVPHKVILSNRADMTFFSEQQAPVNIVLVKISSEVGRCSSAGRLRQLLNPFLFRLAPAQATTGLGLPRG